MRLYRDEMLDGTLTFVVAEDQLDAARALRKYYGFVGDGKIGHALTLVAANDE